MNALNISLFGRFRAQRGQQTLVSLEARKVQELFCYLLLHRDRPHPRETLADLLWSDSPIVQSKSYLRRVLWQLQTALEIEDDPTAHQLLLTDSGWIQINPLADFWLDVAVFEQAFALVQNISGRDLDAERVQSLKSAVDLYQGDLLEGWYQDWCLYERERLQRMYLIMLDKLMDYSEANHDYETGLVYGSFVLRYDRARERTHRRLMRLYYLAGDRTAALRQYIQCVAALKEELGVKPARSTEELYQQIRMSQPGWPTLVPSEAHAAPETVSASLRELLGRLRKLQATLADVQRQVQQDAQTIELVLGDHY